MVETAQKDITVQVNGEARSAPEGSSIAQLLRSIGIDPAKVAVERNREIVPRSTFDKTRVEEGDTLEVVRFVGGG